MRYAFLKFVFTPLCQHISKLGSASLFGACVSLQLFSDGRAAVCAAATPGTTECNHSYYAGNSFSASHSVQQLQNCTITNSVQSLSYTQEANGVASSGFVSSPLLPRSAISSQVPPGPTRNVTGEEMPLAEAVTQLSFLEINRTRFRVMWECRRLPRYPYLILGCSRTDDPTKYSVSARLYTDGFSLSFLVFC